MADIFVEVDEAMKQERLEKLWQQYGGFFIGFLAVIILGTAASAGYNSLNTSKNQAQTTIFLETTSSSNYTAEDLLMISPDLSAGLRSIVNVRAAGLSIDHGDNEKALHTYSELAQNTDTDLTIAQLASYMVIALSKDIGASDKLSKLEAILSDENNPWRYHAMLDASLLEANSKQNYTKARGYLSEILKSKITPKTLKQKAQSLDILYTLKETIQQQSDKT